MAARKSEKDNDPKYDLIWAIIIELIKNGSIIRFVIVSCNYDEIFLIALIKIFIKIMYVSTVSVN